MKIIFIGDFMRVSCFAALFLILENSDGFAQSNCVAPPTGLAAWWPAEGTAKDVIGGINAVLVNGTSFTPGYVGQAFSFNGTSQYITNSPPGLTNIQNSYTMEFWARPNQARASTPESTGNIDGTSNQRYAIFPNNGKFGPAGSGVSVGTNGVSVFESGSAYLPALLVYDTPITNWTHIAVVYSNQQPSLYLNGVLVRVGLTSGRSSYPSTCLGEAGFGYGYYAGLLDEVSIYNRALTAAEIASIYNAGTAGKCLPPTPPYIVVQPTNETVTVGSTATFSVTAGGSPPLSYQWNFNGSTIASATSSALVLPNVQSSNAGLYSVLITNALSSTNSTNATLTVNPAPPPCLAAPAGLVAWWPGEGNANDVAGTNNGFELGGVIYTNGMVGKGFYFNGAGSYVRIPSNPTLGPSNEFTLEFWYKRDRSGVTEGLVARRNSESGPLNYEVGISGGGTIDVFYNDPNVTGDTDNPGTVFELSRYSPAPPAGAFHHIATAYRQADVNTVELKTYLDGQLVRTRNFGGVLNRAINNAPVTIGLSVEYPGYEYFQGVIDEVSLYNRALADSEVQAIYSNGSTGKCFAATAPYIFVQPTNQTASAGSSVTFAVGASGTPSLGYQWFFNATNAITGATNATFVLSSVQLANAGNYSVLVTNAYGSALSSNALLAVTLPPATVRIVSTNALGGSFVSVPIMLVANGNENAMAFSLNFDQTRILYSSTSLGSGAPGADLMLNTTQTNTIQGRLGVEVVMPPGGTFAPGTQIVASVNFFLTNVLSPGSTSISFGDQPIPRQLLDNQLNLLNATYSSGAVTFTVAPGFEADVFPHTNGDRTISLADWLQIGRYVARLDSPTNASEFQRADCAPRSSLGDGSVRATDWIQAGRYNSGLDLLTAAGGPTNEVAPPPLAPSVTRLLSIGSAGLTPGTPATLPITLAAQGNESALSFSVLFDTSRVSFVGASAGPGASGATFFINTNLAPSGLLGFAVALSAGNTFPAGNRELARVSFQALPTASGSFTPIFTDQPAWRDVSDVAALSLPIGYSSGIISINAPLKLRIAQAGTNVLLAWPLWASNFTLQQATNVFSGNSWTNLPVTSSVSNNENVVTLPIGGSLKLYRLYHP